MKTMDIDVLVRPIIGIENRSAREVFDIMSARILSALTPDPDCLIALTAMAYEDAATITSRHKRYWEDAAADIRARIPANALAALSRIEAQAEARGMRKAADIAGDVAITVDPTEWPIAARQAHVARKDILASADATEAAAKGGV